MTNQTQPKRFIEYVWELEIDMMQEVSWVCLRAELMWMFLMKPCRMSSRMKCPHLVSWPSTWDFPAKSPCCLLWNQSGSKGFEKQNRLPPMVFIGVISHPFYDPQLIFSGKLILSEMVLWLKFGSEVSVYT